MDLSRSLAVRAVMAVALMVGYYTLAVTVCVVLLWIPYAEYTYLDRVDLRIGVACLVGAATVLWALVPRPDRFEAPGPQLTPSTEPQLFSLIDDVAAKTAQPRPAEVYLLNEVNAWVSQRGGTMGFGSRRVMGVGLPLLSSLTKAELLAVIAHEFGHYSGGDVGLGPWIYKTRAAIARTMAGLEESYLQWIFNWYGRMFMKMTMAVSRQQEFVADETAARLSGTAPMVSALQKVALLAPAYSTYMQREVLPILRSGFLPPIAEGFARFLDDPETREAFNKMVHEQATGDSSEFDTHPPLSERVAALERLPVAKVTDVRDGALPLLPNPEKEARLLLEHDAGADSIGQLNAIRWEDVGESIYARDWQLMASAHAQWFGALTLGTLPAGKKPYIELGTSLKNPGEDLVDSQDRLARAAFVMIAGLGAALVRSGWTVGTGPGRPLKVTKGDAAVIPPDVISRLINEAGSQSAWQARCEALGIADIPLSPSAPNPEPGTSNPELER
jgi:Zn-dependent protease with chaperone function